MLLTGDGYCLSGINVSYPDGLGRRLGTTCTADEQGHILIDVENECVLTGFANPHETSHINSCISVLSVAQTLTVSFPTFSRQQFVPTIGWVPTS